MDYKALYEAQLEENKKQKREHIKSLMKSKSIATELYREMKYSLGYGEFDEPDTKEMYETIKKHKKMIDRLPNDMEDKWGCEKIERWRWDGDGFEEEEEEN